MQYATSKVDYVIGEFIYMLPRDMNLQNGKVKNYSNKILVSSPSQKDIKSNKEQKQDIKIIRTRPKVGFKKEDKLDIGMMKTEPDANKITYKEEKTALISGITSIFTAWWIFK